MVAKSCNTCDRRNGYNCNASGWSYRLSRQYAVDAAEWAPCDKDYSMWVPRRGIFSQMFDWIFGVK